MWRAYLIETMTGLVGPEVEMSTNGRYDITLNATEQATVTVQKSSLVGITSRWLRPWAQGILLTFETEAKGEEPILAGPITAPPDEYTDSLSFSVSGIRAILAQRIASKEHGVDAEAMRKSSLVYKQRSLAYIARDLVRIALDKEAGALPVRYRTSVPMAGTHDRTYHGYDVANNYVDKRLTELSDASGGPDIMFRPEWADYKHQYIYWGMHTGTPAYPPIEQSWQMVIDADAPFPQVSELTMNLDGSHYATRMYATGDGQGAGIRMAISENRKYYKDQFPLLEGHASSPSASVPSTIRDLARAGVDVKPFIELHATVDGADIRSPLGQWHVGDLATVKPGEWNSIPNIEEDLRILRISGDFDTTHTTIYFQEEQW